MLICSPCFRKDESPQETESVKSVAVCCQGKLDVEDFRARFYCCGRVPPAGFYRKRHGMCDNQEPNNKSSHELDVESNKNSNSSATKIVHPVS